MCKAATLFSSVPLQDAHKEAEAIKLKLTSAPFTAEEAKQAAEQIYLITQRFAQEHEGLMNKVAEIAACCGGITQMADEVHAMAVAKLPGKSDPEGTTGA